MDVLFKKRHFSWAPKFVAVLDSKDHLQWLAEKNRKASQGKNLQTSQMSRKNMVGLA